jgi:hypothetical protein
MTHYNVRGIFTTDQALIASYKLTRAVREAETRISMGGGEADRRIRTSFAYNTLMD